MIPRFHDAKWAPVPCAWQTSVPDFLWYKSQKMQDLLVMELEAMQHITIWYPTLSKKSLYFLDLHTKHDAHYSCDGWNHELLSIWPQLAHYLSQTQQFYRFTKTFIRKKASCVSLWSLGLKSDMITANKNIRQSGQKPKYSSSGVLIPLCK